MRSSRVLLTLSAFSALAVAQSSRYSIDTPPSPLTTPAPPSPFGNCTANCIYDPIADDRGVWSSIGVATTVTAFTEVVIVNNQTNATRTSTITNTKALGSFAIPTETNAQGTRTYKITASLAAYGVNTTWIATYPTPLVSYADHFRWKGQLSTSSKCESLADYTTQFWPKSEYTPIVYPPILRNAYVADAADPRGWNYLYVQASGYLDGPVMTSYFPNEAALRSCSENHLAGVAPAEAVASVASFATSTTTSHEIGAPTPNALVPPLPPSPSPQRPVSAPAPIATTAPHPVIGPQPAPSRPQPSINPSQPTSSLPPGSSAPPSTPSPDSQAANANPSSPLPPNNAAPQPQPTNNPSAVAANALGLLSRPVDKALSLNTPDENPAPTPASGQLNNNVPAPSSLPSNGVTPVTSPSPSLIPFGPPPTSPGTMQPINSLAPSSQAAHNGATSSQPDDDDLPVPNQSPDQDYSNPSTTVAPLTPSNSPQPAPIANAVIVAGSAISGAVITSSPGQSNTAPAIVLGSSTITPNVSGVYSMVGMVITPGGPDVTVSGTPISIGAATVTDISSAGAASGGEMGAACSAGQQYNSGLNSASSSCQAVSTTISLTQTAHYTTTTTVNGVKSDTSQYLAGSQTMTSAGVATGAMESSASGSVASVESTGTHGSPTPTGAQPLYTGAASRSSGLRWAMSVAGLGLLVTVI